MNFQIRSVGFPVEPAHEEYFLERFQRIKRHFDQVIAVSVVLTFERSKEKDLQQEVSVTLCIKGKTFFISHRDAHLHAAIDLLVDRLDRSILEYKARLTRHGGSIKRDYVESLSAN